MDWDAVATLVLTFGYTETARTSYQGEVEKITLTNVDGNHIDIYHTKFAI